MRKLISLLLALMLMLSCVAWADEDEELLEISFGDFTMMVPEDLDGEIADTIENNVPLFMFYEDYDPEATFNSNLICVWSEDMVNIDSVEPTVLAQTILEQTAQQYESMGIRVDDSGLYGAEYFELSGKHGMTALYGFALDYSGLGMDVQCLLYILQMMVPVKDGETYIFTLTTDDLQDCEKLIAVMDSLEWLV